jgi:excisionase family DNA binding protein
MTQSDTALFDKYLTVRAAAERLSVTEGTIRNWVSAGRMVPDGRVGGQLRFLVSTVDAMVEPYRPDRARGQRLRGKAASNGDG